MKIRISTLSHPGMRRPLNEDSFAADPELGIFILADGLGGHAAGEVASRIAVEASHAYLLERIEAAADSDLPHLLRKAVAAANESVRRRAFDDPSCAGMGTTLDLLLLRVGDAWICHVGDSRIYRLREGLEQMTEDHDQAAALRKAGADENTSSALFGHMLTRAVGTSGAVEPDIRSFAVRTSDLFLLCSDGLTDMMSDSEIAAVLCAHRESLDAAARRLIDEANSRGGLDNITVILVEVVL